MRIVLQDAKHRDALHGDPKRRMAQLCSVIPDRHWVFTQRLPYLARGGTGRTRAGVCGPSARGHSGQALSWIVATKSFLVKDGLK
jgi:hypothetical protein